MNYAPIIAKIKEKVKSFLGLFPARFYTMLLGHAKQVEYFDKALRNNKLSHAYLFHGPEHIGKFTFAKTVAQYLNCPNTHISRDRTKDAYLENICG
jgi:DNA polymerase III gamma/tau subunit